MMTTRVLGRILAGLAVAALLAGCQNTPNERVIFANATLNGQPMNLALDTGAPEAGLFRAGAERLGLKVTPLPSAPRTGPVHTDVGYSESLEIAVGAQKLAGSFPVLLWNHDELNQDGLVGWSNVRNNILVFDGGRHTVTGVAEVPAEATNWLKLKIRPAAVLQLEILLRDGSTGTLLVDTGWMGGIALARDRWREWRATRPFVHSVEHTMTGPSIEMIDRTEAWADTVAIGPLTLTDVPVREAVAVELALTPGFVGSLGLYALERMDFIVDGKNGFAYLRPKLAPGPPYPGIRRPNVANNNFVPQDWIIEGDVTLARELRRSSPRRSQP